MKQIRISVKVSLFSGFLSLFQGFVTVKTLLVFVQSAPVNYFPHQPHWVEQKKKSLLETALHLMSFDYKALHWDGFPRFKAVSPPATPERRHISNPPLKDLGRVN